MNVHISQFYSCSEVELACELYYICELGKYSYILHGKPVSLDGIILNVKLKKSPIWHYFRMACDKGWLCDSGVSADELLITIQTPLKMDKQHIANYLYGLDEVPYDAEDAKKRREDDDYDLTTPLHSQISFEKRTDDYWLWSVNGFEGRNFVTNNRSLNHNLADQSWLSVIAMVAVNRLYAGVPTNLLLQFNNNTVLNDMALSYIMILTDETQCLTGWCHFNLDETIPSKTRLQLGYTAWYAKGRDIGLLNRWYTGKEKYKYAKKLDIQKGDLVMYYEREKAQRMNTIKSIASCHLAKITKLTDDVIGLELINTVKPYFQGKEDFDNHTIAVKNMYIGNYPYEKLSTSRKELSLADIGIEYLMYTEKCFICPLTETDDEIKVRVSDGVRKDTLVLDQNNLIYWILKDYDYDFNEEHFLATNFKTETPVYTRYMSGETLENYWYYKEEEEDV